MKFLGYLKGHSWTQKRLVQILSTLIKALKKLLHGIKKKKVSQKMLWSRKGYLDELRCFGPKVRLFRPISYRFGATATSTTQISENIMLGIMGFASFCDPVGQNFVRFALSPVVSALQPHQRPKCPVHSRYRLAEENPLSRLRAVALADCRATELSRSWSIALASCRACELSRLRPVASAAVALASCRACDLSRL